MNKNKTYYQWATYIFLLLFVVLIVGTFYVTDSILQIILPIVSLVCGFTAMHTMQKLNKLTEKNTTEQNAESI